MTSDSAREKGHGKGDELDAVRGTDPDLTVPGASDTAESGGQGADDRYVQGELGGGAIGAEIDEDESEGDEG